MVMLESGDAVAFDIKEGGLLELTLTPSDGDPETVALRGKDVAVLLAGDGLAGPLRVRLDYSGNAMVWTLTTAQGGRGGTTVSLLSREMSMLCRAVESRMWRMYQ